MKLRKLTLLLLSCMLIFSLLPGCTPTEEPDTSPDPNQQTVQQEVTLYFGNSFAEGLEAEKRTLEVEDVSALPAAAVEALIAGPEDEALAPTIPEEAKLLALTLEDNIAYVDFSQELISKHWGGSYGETMTILSVVNTLTEFDNIDKVQFLVDGEKTGTIAGHWDTSEPIERDESEIISD